MSGPGILGGYAWTNIGQVFSASAAASRKIIFAIREQALARQLAECAILHARAVFKSAILIGMNARSENVINAARLRYFESRKIVGLRAFLERSLVCLRIVLKSICH